MKAWFNKEALADNVDATNTPHSEFPDVKAAHEAYIDAVVALSALQAEEKRINKLLSPYVVSDGTPVDPIQCAYAQAELPEVQRQLAIAEAVKIQRERGLSKVTDAARHRITEARLPGRRPLMQALFRQLEECARIAEQLSDYDQRTQVLGGSAPECPFIELLPEWTSCGQSKVAYCRERFAEWLD